MTTDQAEEERAFVQIVLGHLTDFEAKHDRALTPEERMSFIAGHAAGFNLGQQVEASRHD